MRPSLQREYQPLKTAFNHAQQILSLQSGSSGGFPTQTAYLRLKRKPLFPE